MRPKEKYELFPRMSSKNLRFVGVQTFFYEKNFLLKKSKNPF